MKGILFNGRSQNALNPPSNGVQGRLFSESVLKDVYHKGKLIK